MISIHREEDLHQLAHLANKKNILARFVMNGCHWCEESQPEWNSFTSRYSGNVALAEIESSFLEHFQQSMANRDPIPVNGFPTIVLIRSSRVIPVPSLQKIKRKLIQPKSNKTNNPNKTNKPNKSNKTNKPNKTNKINKTKKNKKTKTA